MEAEKRREVPKEAFLPTTRCSKLGVLGTATADSERLRNQGFTTDQLRSQYAEIQKEEAEKMEGRIEERRKLLSDSISWKQP